MPLSIRLLVLFCLSLPNYIFGQNTTIQGYIKDAETKEILSDVSVLLQVKVDTGWKFKTATNTDEQGKFMFSNIEANPYQIVIQLIGYKTHTQKITNTSIPIQIALSPSSKNTLTKEAEVVSEKSILQTGVEKKVFQVGKDLSVTGGTATNVLQNVPTVNVDMEGNVSLRGSGNVTIWINGKPTGVTGDNKAQILQQIPANQIESVEIITNPSSKYDANGSSGILNIVLKKNTQTGWNATAAITLGTIQKYTPAGTFNYRNKKINLTTAYTYRYYPSYGKRVVDRTFNYTTTDFLFHQDLKTKDTTISHTARIALDYNLTSKTTTGISLTFAHKDFDRTELFNNYYTDLQRNPIKTNQRTIQDVMKTNNIDAIYFIKHIFQPKKELNAAASYSYNYSNTFTNYTQTGDNSNRDNNDFTENNTFATAQVDYTQPIFSSIKLETGAKWTQTQVDNLVDYKSYNTTTTNWINNPLYTNHFLFKENTYAVYLQASGNARKEGKWSKLAYQAGLRYEYATNNSTLLTTNEQYTNVFKALFPSASAKYNLKENIEIFATFSKRVNRPGAGLVNPFPNYADPLTIRKGNPNIKPEYAYNYELGATRYHDKLFLTTTIYYRHTVQAFSRVGYPDSTGKMLILHQNVGTANNIGIEITAKYTINKKIDILFNPNLYQQEVQSNLAIIDNKVVKGWASTYKLILNYKPDKVTDIQLLGNYMTPLRYAQGTYQGMNMVNISARRTIFNQKATIALTLSDILNQMQHHIKSQGINFKNELQGKRESRILNLTFTYKWGNTDLPTKKQTPAMPTGGGGGEGY